MAYGEIHIQLSVNFVRDPKVRKLIRYGVDSRALRDLYVQMVCYSKESLTDGFVPAEEVGVMCYPDTWDNAQRDADRLAEVGLVEKTTDGYMVTAYLKRNKSRSQVEEDARLAEDSAAFGNHRRWHEAKGIANPKCSYCRPTPVPESGGDRVPDRGGESGAVEDPIGTQQPPESTETETETETETKDKEHSSSTTTSDPATDHVRAKREARERHDNETFDRFWVEYPRKDGKREARKAWPKALKAANVETLVKAAALYRDRMGGTSREHIKMPGPWLNAERWADEVGENGEPRTDIPAAQTRSKARNIGDVPFWDM